jgi:hypothetical protein
VSLPGVPGTIARSHCFKAKGRNKEFDMKTQIIRTALAAAVVLSTATFAFAQQSDTSNGQSVEGQTGQGVPAPIDRPSNER